jgi:hypothetical protein
MEEINEETLLQGREIEVPAPRGSAEEFEQTKRELAADKVMAEKVDPAAFERAVQSRGTELRGLELEVTLRTIRRCFARLGFFTLRSPDAANNGAKSVTLMLKEKDGPVTERHQQFRLVIEQIPEIGQVASLEFRTGEAVWLKFNQTVTKPEKAFTGYDDSGEAL